MTRDEITRAAAEVGAHRYTNRYLPGEPAHAFSIEQLERFAALVAAREREACAQVCEQQNVSNLTIDVLQGSRHGIQEAATLSCGKNLAAAIRARGAATQPLEPKPYRGPLRTPAGDPRWISRAHKHMPAPGQRVRVLMDAGRVANTAHPGYPGGKWEEETTVHTSGGPQGATFMCELCQTGAVTHWMPA